MENLCLKNKVNKAFEGDRALEDEAIVLIGGFIEDDLDHVEIIPDNGDAQSCSALPFASDYMVALRDGQGQAMACAGRGNPVDGEKREMIYLSKQLFSPFATNPGHPGVLRERWRLLGVEPG